MKDSSDQAPRELKKSVCARTLKYPKIDPQIQIFAFYCIFALQFSKVSVCPGIHGIHRYAAPGGYGVTKCTRVDDFGGLMEPIIRKVYSSTYVELVEMSLKA